MPKVILGMSGGMDSSMSAILLQQDGYEVIGATLLTHGDENAESIKAAIKLANELNITHHLIDCREQFKADVIDYFINDYLSGKTPNPCIRCNETIKWRLLNNLAQKLNCNHIATGHYVQIKELEGSRYISKGIDPTKDQSYFLWNLNQDIVDKALFPLGTLKKSEVRNLARSLGYNNFADKKESMGVCFLSGTDYRNYLMNYLPLDHPATRSGEVLDTDGNKLGEHEGFPFYTLGQKRGIENVAKGNCVIKILPNTNTLITGSREKLFASE